MSAPSPAHFVPEPGLSWQDHFVRYGFARFPGIVPADWCAEALTVVRAYLGDDRPLDQWDVDRPGPKLAVFYDGDHPVLDTLFAQAGLLAMLEELFTPPGHDGPGPVFHFGALDVDDPDRRHYTLLVTPFDPDAQPRYNPRGHVDSGDPYRGVAMYLSLVDTEPFSGNTVFFPGTHHIAHARQLAHPDPDFKGGVAPSFALPHPVFEWVATAGELILASHLCYHIGNPSHSAHRLPRVVLRIEAYLHEPPTAPWVLDPANQRTPFERSLAIPPGTPVP